MATKGRTVYGRFTRGVEKNEAPYGKGFTPDQWRKLNVAGKPILVEHNWQQPGAIGTFTRNWVEYDKRDQKHWCCIEGMIDTAKPAGAQAMLDIMTGKYHAWSVSLIQKNPERGLVDDNKEFLEGSLTNDPKEEGTQVCIRHNGSGGTVEVQNVSLSLATDGGDPVSADSPAESATSATPAQPAPAAAATTTTIVPSSDSQQQLKKPEETEKQKTAADVPEQKTGDTLTKEGEQAKTQAPQASAVVVPPPSPVVPLAKPAATPVDTPMADATKTDAPPASQQAGTATNTAPPAKEASTANNTEKKDKTAIAAPKLNEPKKAASQPPATEAKKKEEKAPAPAKKPVEDEEMADAPESKEKPGEGEEDEAAEEKPAPPAKKAPAKEEATKKADQAAKKADIKETLMKVAGADPESRKAVTDFLEQVNALAEETKLLKKEREQSQLERERAAAAKKAEAAARAQEKNSVWDERMKEAAFEATADEKDVLRQFMENEDAGSKAAETLVDRLSERVWEQAQEINRLKKARPEQGTDKSKGAVTQEQFTELIAKLQREMTGAPEPSATAAEPKRKVAPPTVQPPRQARTDEILVANSRTGAPVGSMDVVAKSLASLDNLFDFDPERQRAESSRVTEMIKARRALA